MAKSFANTNLETLPLTKVVSPHCNNKPPGSVAYPVAAELKAPVIGIVPAAFWKNSCEFVPSVLANNPETPGTAFRVKEGAAWLAVNVTWLCMPEPFALPVLNPS